MGKSGPNLVDLVALECLQQLQDGFAAMSRATMVIVNAQGERITRASNWGGFCDLLCQNDEGLKLCLKHNSELGSRCKESAESVIALCPHTGCTTGSVPILLDGRYLGSWLIGQVRVGPPSQASLGRMERTIALLEISREKAEEVMQGLPSMSMAEFGRLFSFLKTLTGTIVDMGRSNREMVRTGKELRGLAREMEIRQQVLTRFIESSNDAMYICDFYTGELVMANESYCRQANLPKSEIMGKKCWDVNGLSNHDFCSFCPRSRLLDADLKPAGPYTWEYYNEKFGLWLRCTHQALTWPDGRAVHMVTQQDITQEHAMMQRLERLAFYDLQTGLPNGHMLVKRLEGAIEEEENFERNMICLYLSSLRKINDLYGEATEEEILKEVTGWLRSADFGDRTLYRLGRDEFCLVLRGSTPEYTLAAARFIKERFDHPWQITPGGNEFSFVGGISMSVLHFPSKDISHRGILNIINRTLGRARITEGLFVYDEEEDRQSREHTRLEIDLKRCITQGMEGFAVHYQPIVEISSGTWKGLEALCRWTSREFGQVAPPDFIHEAERQGLIMRLGLWVLDQAVGLCKQLGLDAVDGFFLSVNISPIQIMDEHLAEHVLDILKRYDYPGDKLNLEVTESVEMTFSSFIRSVIDELRGHGVKMALDDFGSGYSSFNNLKHMPVNFLKTEQAFIQGIENDSYMQYFLYVMSEISHACGMRLIAEGIETVEQLRVVKNNGADYIQGYFFSKPLPPEVLKQRLERFAVQDPSFATHHTDVLNINQWLSGKSAYELTPNLFMLLNQCIQVLLSEADFQTAIEDVLAIVGKHFSVSRAFVFMLTGTGEYSNLYEWCAPDVSPQKHLFTGIDVLARSPSLLEAFRSEGMVVVSDVSKLPPDFYAELKTLDMKSMALLPIWEKKDLVGFVGFEKLSFHDWSSDAVVMLWNLAMFMRNSIKREKLRREVTEKNNILDGVLQTSGLSSFISDPYSDDILWINEVLKNSREDGASFVGRKCHDVFYGLAERCPFCKKPEMLSHPEVGQISYEMHNPHWDRDFMIYETIMPWMGDRRVHIGYALDITEQRRMQRQIEYFMAKDVLTGALNRAKAMEAMENLWRETLISGRPFAVCGINVHDLKRINAAYGHDMGDQVLSLAVKAINACVRDTDIVGRMSGDEFIVIFPDSTKVEARARMSRAGKRLARATPLPGGEMLSFTAGLADSTETNIKQDSTAAREELIRLAGCRMRGEEPN